MSDLAWETLTSDVAYSCDGFDVINETISLPDGTTAEFDYLTEPASVVVLPFRPDGDVVVIEEWRHAVGRMNRGLPAGTLEPGEEPEDAAYRELTEETGYEAEDVEHLTSIEPSNGFSDSVFHYFVATGCEKVGDQALDTDESIRVETATLDSLREAVRANELRDGRSALGVLYYTTFEGKQS
jgi:ADP-ribose pyrophosphatase